MALIDMFMSIGYTMDNVFWIGHAVNFVEEARDKAQARL